jgi:hypothetical protein
MVELEVLDGTKGQRLLALDRDPGAPPRQRHVEPLARADERQQRPQRGGAYGRGREDDQAQEDNRRRRLAAGNEHDERGADQAGEREQLPRRKRWCAHRHA